MSFVDINVLQVTLISIIIIYENHLAPLFCCLFGAGMILSNLFWPCYVDDGSHLNLAGVNNTGSI